MRMCLRWQRFCNLIVFKIDATKWHDGCKVVWHGEPIQEGMMIGHSYFVEMPFDAINMTPRTMLVKM